MRVLITGGGGFLGGVIARRLVERGDRVRSLARSSYQALDALGIDQFRGDVARLEDVERAVDGVDAVVHVAAKAGVWGSHADFHRANVVGTRNVIAACRSSGVPRLVHTSSPSVVAGRNGGDIEGADESLPYPDDYAASYPATKAEAERAVLAANGPGLATVTLRPHLIWGPGDNHLAPRIIDRARRGRLRRVGDGSNRVDSIYVDNAADAHILAIDRLESGCDSPPAGRAYFISQDEPRPLWELVDAILRAAGLPPATRSISPRFAHVAGLVLETVHRTFRRPGEPMMTRFVAHQLSASHWFDMSAARRDLGYHPRISIDQGFERLAAWFADHPPA